MPAALDATRKNQRRGMGMEQFAEPIALNDAELAAVAGGGFSHPNWSSLLGSFTGGGNNSGGVTVGNNSGNSGNNSGNVINSGNIDITNSFNFELVVDL